VHERAEERLFNDKTISGFLLLVGLFNAIPAFLVTLRDSLHYPGVDLRCKVVAARAMLRGLDPYIFEWREGMPLELLDATRRHPGPSRANYPPTLLMLYAPLAGLPYRVQRSAWFILEWSSLIASLALLAGTIRPRAAKTALLALGLFFFVAGDIWRFHVERGQFYVFVLLLLTLGTRSLLRGDLQWGRAGLYFGLATAFRPTFLIVAVPLALLGYRKTAGAMAAVLAVAMLLTLPLVGLRGWASYAAQVRVYEQVAASSDKGAEFLGRTYGPARAVPTAGEGGDLVGFLPIETGGSTLIGSFKPIHARLVRFLALPPLTTIARSASLAMALAVGCLALALRRTRRVFSGRFVAAFATVAAIDLEYFLPVRYSYSDILFLQPLALLVPSLFRQNKLALARTCILAGLVLGQYRSLLGGFTEFLEFTLLASGLTIALLQIGRGRVREPACTPATSRPTEHSARSPF
jgi:hypothetical protein